MRVHVEAEWRRVRATWTRTAPARAWIRTHLRLAVVGFVVLALANVAGFAALNDQHNKTTMIVKAACRDRQHQWQALHDVIKSSYRLQKPPKALLAAFPQLKPFYTPGNKSYDEQAGAANARSDEVLGVLGPFPSC